MAEFKTWAPSLKLITYYGAQEDRRRIRHSAKKRKETVDVLLTTYNMIGSRSDDRKFFKNFSLNYVVNDEGHMLKNCSTDRYKSLIKIKTQRKILLTGTPLQNNLIELISLMYFTMTRIFTKYCDDITQLLSHFKQQRPALEGTDSRLYQQDRIEQAKAILQPYILRRVKSQVLSELPPKTEETVEVYMLSEQEKFYIEVVDSLRNEDGETSNAYGGLMRLRQTANHPLLRRRLYEDRDCLRIAKTLVTCEKAYEKKKVEHVAEDLEALSDFAIHQLCEKYADSCERFLLKEKTALASGKVAYLDKKLPEIQAKGDKVLIFSQFTSLLDILEVFLKMRGFKFCRLDGSTPVLERLPLINEFNNSPGIFIFLLSTRAGGLGINLVSANCIILHDIDFNPYNDKQAEDRCHRMGQKKAVHVIRLISKNTIEVDINRLARKKLKLEKDVTEGSRGLEDGLSTTEAKELLEAVTKSATGKTKSKH